MPWKLGTWQLSPWHTLSCLCPSPQASSSTSPPLSAWVTMHRVAAFCATHSPQLTLPFLQASLFAMSFLKERQRSVADKAKSCWVKRGARAHHPCIPRSPRALLQRHCLGSFVCQSYPFRAGQAKVSVGRRRTLRNGVILIWQNWKRH